MRRLSTALSYVILTGLPLISVGSAQAVVSYQFRMSASAESSFVVTAPPANGLRDLYLWLTCAYPGISAMEATVTATSQLQVVGFTPSAGVVNLGSPTHLLLGIGGCPTGDTSVVLGHWTVWDLGGTLCFLPDSASTFATIDCNVFPGSYPDPELFGFSSNAEERCHIGASLCQPVHIPPVAVDPTSWGRIKSWYQ